MSRTDNTMPLHIQIEDGKIGMHTAGGSYARIGRDTRYEEKRARQRVRLTLQRGEQPEPTRHRGNAKWMYW